MPFHFQSMSVDHFTANRGKPVTARGPALEAPKTTPRVKGGQAQGTLIAGMGGYVQPSE